ncbi:ferredoxin-type protein NapH [Rhodobium orientis]|uniref:Quinol dehydrogenase ferredoxin subunit NapH n=1 Tax=Rhodobium orientis TaxID=34017 RepID=A0A327JVE6_9HYPH|nr:quinol dehydrogenase ferredoxin subunit NapH [Rhodobium orientis]MBB4301993.1 ferredoxin-type protein NapH [Rhodobium orientis]MBK5950230.1 quinol dehydrogenase ferredoxin subunit NapH [Rhodobium orientis]RAI27168.1 quinol dehydrogenase ferredoxin subunit NapH [Rhodobium orientis]
MVTPLKDLGKDAIAVKGWFGAHKWLLLRRATQVGILVLFLIGPWAGLWLLKGNLAASTVLDTVPLTDPLLVLQMLAAGFVGLASTALLGAAIVAVFYVLVGGRAYCSWVCPVNIVTDGAHWLRRRLDIRQSARLKPSARWWMLGLTLVVSAATGTLAFELVNPVSMLHRGLIFGIGIGWAVIAAIFLFDLFVARHGWCGHLCPMGAFYGLLGSASLVRVRADGRDNCDDCMECYEVCPEPQVIPPAVKSAAAGGSPVILSGACTNCGRCIDICPNDVYAFGLRGRALVTPRPLPADHPRNSAPGFASNVQDDRKIA